MSVRDVGDGHPIGYEARDPDTGDLVAATVALAVVDPAGNSTPQSPSNPSTGVYEYTIDLTSAGLWRWVWTVTGAVEDKAYGEVVAADPAPGLYATISDLRREMGESNGRKDDQLASALASVSREIDEYCSVPPGAFRPAATASARVFEPESHCMVRVDPFYTTAGLIVATDDGSGTYATTWASTDYQTEPLNAVAYGKPITAIRALRGRRFPCWYGPASVQVTAKWGWPTVPDPVRQACLLLAAETMKLTAEAPFGVAGFGEFGPFRVRNNPVAMTKLAPYQRWPVLIG